MQTEFLDLVYGSIVDTALWVDVLQRVTDAMGGEGSALVWQDLLNHKPGGVFTRLDPEAVSLYTGYFATRNPLRAQASEVIRKLPGWTPAIVLDEDRLPKDDFLKTEFYNDYFRRFGFHSSATVGLQIDGTSAGMIEVLRSRARGAFSEGELAFAREAQPHLVRAFRLGREMSAEGADQGLAAALDTTSASIFILSEEGRVRHVNPAGEALTRRGDILRVLSGRLIGVNRQVHRRLEALVGAALAEPGSRSGGSITIPADGKRLPISISVTPMPATGNPVFDRPSVMVRATDPERADLPSPEQLREVFRLTATETKVSLALLEGLQTPDVAARLGNSVNTVRNHVASIFEKTRSSDRAELSRRLMSLL